MTLKQLLNLLDWFEKFGGLFPTLEQPSLDFIAKINKEINLAKSRTSEQSLLTKAESFLNQYLMKTEPLNLFKASLKWLRDTSETSQKNKLIAQQKIGMLFSKLLDLGPVEAIDFYKQELKAIYPLGEVLIANYENEKKIAENQKEINQLATKKLEDLQEIEQPLSLVPYLDFDNIADFSASIIWLLRRGEGEESILATGILQSFFISNTYCLAEENNPIQSFYNLLDEFKEAEQLLLLASKIRTQDKAFENYNLRGQLCPQESLNLIQIIEPPFIKNLDGELFNKLYLIFGIKFLYSAIHHLDETADKQLTLILKDAFNISGNGLVFVALPQLLNLLLASYEEVALDKHLKNLASLISKETFLKHLLTNKQWTLFYLLPYTDNFFDEEQQFITSFSLVSDDFNIDPYKKWILLLMLMCPIIENEKNYPRVHYLLRIGISLILSTDSLLVNQWVLDGLCEVYKALLQIQDPEMVQTSVILDSHKNEIDNQWGILCKDFLENPVRSRLPNLTRTMADSTVLRRTLLNRLIL